MSKNELDRLLEKLSERIGSGDNDAFSRKEVDAIRRVIRTYEMLESWGKLGKWLIWLAMTFAGLAIAWSQVKGEYLQ